MPLKYSKNSLNISLLKDIIQELKKYLQSKGCCSVDVLVEAALEDEAPVLVLAEVAEGL